MLSWPMFKEQKRDPTDPPIVEPKDFLARPFTRLEVGELPESPNIILLQWLPTLKGETGLVYRMSRWFVVKASEFGIPGWLMPSSSEILVHSHPIDEDEEENDGSIPSLRDYLNCSSIAKNFIVSQKGITQYWPVEGNDSERKRYVWRAVDSVFGREDTKQKYLEFLDEIGARFIVYPWKELDEEKLSKLLSL